LPFDPQLSPVIITAALVLIILGAIAAPQFLGLPPRAPDLPDPVDSSTEAHSGRREVFRYYSEPLGSLDPALASDAYASIVIAQIFSPLVGLTSDLEPGLVLRQSWAWERVLINLFSNAVRAMPEGGIISTQARRKNGRIQIVVADQGSGIPPEMLANLFQANVSTKSAGGLGLHIVQTIAKQQDSEVRAANRIGRTRLIDNLYVKPRTTRGKGK